MYDIRILARSSCVSPTSRLVWVGHGLHQPSQQLQPRSFRAFAQHRRQRRLAVRRRVAAVRICLRCWEVGTEVPREAVVAISTSWW